MSRPAISFATLETRFFKFEVDWREYYAAFSRVRKSTNGGSRASGRNWVRCRGFTAGPFPPPRGKPPAT